MPFGERPGGGARMPVAPTGPSVSAVVKWFNPEKGFGFVELKDGSGDAFLHIAVLESSGHGAVAPGTTLLVNKGQGQKGAQVTAVLEVDASTAVAEAPRQSRPMGGSGGGGGPRLRDDQLASAVEMTGTVKWYNPAKGFGFVAVQDGGKDVFIHASVLERARIAGLQDGQAVTLRVVEGMKGREAVGVEIAG
ncbi:MAG TPA: cold shock domain-containing protein [Aliidongia sp.]|nr:cold shock domain-containing protein [Aliidongia sp.]